MKICIFLLALFASSFAFTNTVLFRPYITDGCTGYKDGIWLHCCQAHDLAYWAGGVKEHREEADMDLKLCVRETGSELQSEIMYLGIKLGTLSPIKLKGKQWGNAWGNKPLYKPLTVEEIGHLQGSLLTEQTIYSEEQVELFISQLIKNNSY